MLSSDSGADAAASADTSLLYSGEQYDGASDQYYLRARYYNPASGTFNRTDPYAGNTQDPQSLHKYAYVHNNPINAIDPLGKMSLIEVTGTLAQIGRAIIKYYPILKYGLAFADVLSVINIILKAITQGISSVTIGEWTEFALITGTAFLGGKVARRIAKSMIMRALEIPARALGSFKILRRFIQSKGVLVFVENFVKYNDYGERVLGRFRLLGGEDTSRPVIYLYKGGEKVSVLIHEFVHYRQWKRFVGGTDYDWRNFSSIKNVRKNFEAIAYFVGDVFSK